MADVFISYSKPQRHLTEALAKELEAKGLDVWWDTELIAGESFRERIQQELKACKAAIVIWTPDSVSSDYVLSEAERARMARKLIQVRTEDIEPHDLPPPFDTSHVPLIEDRRSIYAGLARLGVLDGAALGAGAAPGPSALFESGSAPKRPFLLTRSGLVIVGLAGLALMLAGLTAYVGKRLTPSAAQSPADLQRRAQRTFEGFTASLNGGLADTSMFASEVRLGRRGLLSLVDATAELRKLEGTYSRVACRSDPGSITVKKAERTPDGYRAIAVTTCDFTDKAGQKTTERFPLEVEGVRSGGRDVITGLWLPEKMVLWQPR